MQPILTLERIFRLQRVLDRYGGTAKQRLLMKNHGFQIWEIAEAVKYEWVTVSKIPASGGRSGRPSFFVSRVSKSCPTKCPPTRGQLPKRIPIRHFYFAMHSLSYVKNADGILQRKNLGQAYLAAFPAARSLVGAKASASRLLRRPSIKMLRQYFQAYSTREIPKHSYPTTFPEMINLIKTHCPRRMIVQESWVR